MANTLCVGLAEAAAPRSREPIVRASSERYSVVHSKQGLWVVAYRLKARTQWSNLFRHNSGVARFCRPKQFVMTNRHASINGCVIEFVVHPTAATAACCVNT